MKLPDFVTDFMKTFTDNNHKIYLVGGAVRHLVMNEPIVNWDFTTSAKPEEIMKLFSRSFYNNQFGTVGTPIEIDGETIVMETTTFRRESEYTNTRHPDRVEWADTVEEDLGRRDFTMNAIAYDGNEIIDPYNGRADIEKKVIRAVGDADIRFNEDALRLMRAIRQAAQHGFVIEPATLTSIQKNAELITKISWERIHEEFSKILTSKYPADGIFFLKNTGILMHILPEVDMCFAIPQKSPNRHHIYDVGTHLVESLRHCPSLDAITRFATLIHDVGKAKTFRKDEKTEQITFYNHEVVGAHQAREIAERFKLSKKDKEKLITLVKHHQFSVTEEQTDKAIRRFIRDVGLENIEDMLALRTADRLGGGAKETSWRTELFKKRIIAVQNVPFAVTDLKIKGTDVMEVLGIRPGRKVGEVLDAIFAEVDEGTLQNERERLMKKIEQYK